MTYLIGCILIINGPNLLKIPTLITPPNKPLPSITLSFTTLQTPILPPPNLDLHLPQQPTPHKNHDEPT
jgi:hypothetical protein